MSTTYQVSWSKDGSIRHSSKSGMPPFQTRESAFDFAETKKKGNRCVTLLYCNDANPLNADKYFLDAIIK